MWRLWPVSMGRISRAASSLGEKDKWKRDGVPAVAMQKLILSCGRDVGLDLLGGSVSFSYIDSSRWMLSSLVDSVQTSDLVKGMSCRRHAYSP